MIALTFPYCPWACLLRYHSVGQGGCPPASWRWRQPAAQPGPFPCVAAAPTEHACPFHCNRLQAQTGCAAGGPQKRAGAGGVDNGARAPGLLGCAAGTSSESTFACIKRTAFLILCTGCPARGLTQVQRHRRGRASWAWGWRQPAPQRRGQRATCRQLLGRQLGWQGRRCVRQARRDGPGDANVPQLHQHAQVRPT